MVSEKQRPRKKNANKKRICCSRLEKEVGRKCNVMNFMKIKYINEK